MSNPFTASAVRFRLTMAIVLIIMTIFVIVIAFMGVKWLNGYAKEVSEVVYKADTSQERLNGIKNMAKQLDSQKDAVEKAQRVVAESKSYQYQDVIINDLDAMARNSGLTITNYDFTTAGGSSASGGGSSSAAPAKAPASAVAPAPGATGASPVGSALKSTSVNITLQSPVEYKSILKFIHYVEQNLTKMQIASISLSSAQEDKNKLTSDSLTIEVYIK